MEPIVVMGLIVVAYGGYISIVDCPRSFSGALHPTRKQPGGKPLPKEPAA